VYKEKKNIYIVYLLVDVLLIGLSFYLPYSFRYNQTISWGPLPHYKDYLFLFIIWAGVLISFLKSKRLYSTDRSITIPKEVRVVFSSVVFSAVLTGLMIFILQIRVFSRLVFFQSFLFLFFSLASWRLIKRLLIRYRLCKGLYNYNVLIVGAGKTGLVLVDEIEKRPFLGLEIVGFFDNHKEGEIAGYKVLSNRIEEFEDILQKYFVEEVYITIPSQRDLVSKIIALSKKRARAVYVVADNFTSPFYRLELNYLGLIPVLKYSGSKLHGTEMYAKRILDLAVAAISLFLLFPVFVALGVLIRIDSRGPVFYKSIRCGRRGKPFTFYKFRSMVLDADKQKEDLFFRSEVAGPVFKIKEDPRITKAGKILRRYSLDELPQLLNVIKGQMSLVGPRPPTPDEVEKYDIWQMRRLDVRPGITGLWQVRGRSTLSFYKWVKLDLWYIDNWSFYLDLLIIFWTIPVIIKRKGAY
jgi:exopolysaccharide biosynthesis polyprenyl glycosylphosphotransferase